MSILTKRNGVALIAVLAVLLVLTLLIPALFTMSQTATKAAMEGTDQQKASYLARSMIEMTVASFQTIYDMADEYEKTNDSVSAQGKENYKCWNELNKFLNDYKVLDAQTLYMYGSTTIEFPIEPLRIDYASDNAYQEAMEEYNEKFEYYENNGVIYSSDPTVPTGFKLIGTAECKVTYNDDIAYYAIEPNGNTVAITKAEYDKGSAALEAKISSGQNVIGETQYIVINNKNVIFQSSALVNGKGGVRRCILVLPTKPSEENWITVANLEVGCNQIFPDTDLATGKTVLNYSSGVMMDGSALKQPLYIFSCIGNMVISDEDLSVTRTNANGVTETIPYYQYLREQNANYRPQDMSFGLHPETGTKNPENDPTFSCLATYNMNSWADDAQLDNFVAFTATNAIQVDLPVNLIVNPARTFRIGDGLDQNSSLYKVLVFQAPTIVFNDSVASFVSLYRDSLELTPAYRMTSIMFAAPQSTPYSYLNDSRGCTVKAGKVYFAEDAYIWLVPYGEDGSSYKTSTVYYKNDDIILYKIANAGDIYYFNSEIETVVDGKPTNTGFSLTGYFLDVIYNEHGNDFNNNEWWQFYSNAKAALFNMLVQNFATRTYYEDDFKWIGNVKSGTGDKLPVVDDFYVIWDS